LVIADIAPTAAKPAHDRGPAQTGTARGSRRKRHPADRNVLEDRHLRCKTTGDEDMRKIVMLAALALVLAAGAAAIVVADTQQAMACKVRYCP
jgi:hypothetical protein